MYGMVGLKTHSKVALVVRNDGDMLRRYVHIGTGNYNAKTSRIYEDIGVLTCSPDIGDDATGACQLPHRLQPIRGLPTCSLRHVTCAANSST